MTTTMTTGELRKFPVAYDGKDGKRKTATIKAEDEEHALFIARFRDWGNARVVTGKDDDGSGNRTRTRNRNRNRNGKNVERERVAEPRAVKRWWKEPDDAEEMGGTGRRKKGGLMMAGVRRSKGPYRPAVQKLIDEVESGKFRIGKVYSWSELGIGADTEGFQMDLAIDRAPIKLVSTRRGYLVTRR